MGFYLFIYFLYCKLFLSISEYFDFVVNVENIKTKIYIHLEVNCL